MSVKFVVSMYFVAGRERELHFTFRPRPAAKVRTGPKNYRAQGLLVTGGDCVGFQVEGDIL